MHMDCLKPYLPDISGEAIPCYYYKILVVTERSDTYVVEKILKHRTNKAGHQEWLVKWRGYRKATWEPVQSFIEDFQIDWLEYNRKENVTVDFRNIPCSSVHHIDYTFLQ